VRSSIDCTWLDWRSRRPSLSVVITQLAPSLSPLPGLPVMAVPVIAAPPLPRAPPMPRAMRRRLMARSSAEEKEREGLGSITAPLRHLKQGVKR
jgi:hypothetical protein